MTKVFFGCSMMGGFPNVNQNSLRKVMDSVEELGYSLVSRHQTNPFFQKDEVGMTFQQIHDRDYEWLLEGEICIFEISNPSLGVGAELSTAISLGKPVLCLFQRQVSTSVSAFILGKEGSKYVPGIFQCKTYASIEEAKEIIKNFVESQFS
ncbi:MAG: hypothetical protein HUU50_07095 [Candidatus Brocadiae bacterium]|nr:hypothetical protein [Candidatus Brocadiia bacterium]